MRGKEKEAKKKLPENHRINYARLRGAVKLMSKQLRKHIRLIGPAEETLLRRC